MAEIVTVWLVHISPSRLLGHRERKGRAGMRNHLTVV